MWSMQCQFYVWGTNRKWQLPGSSDNTRSAMRKHFAKNHPCINGCCSEWHPCMCTKLQNQKKNGGKKRITAIADTSWKLCLAAVRERKRNSTGAGPFPRHHTYAKPKPNFPQFTRNTSEKPFLKRTPGPVNSVTQWHHTQHKRFPSWTSCSQYCTNYNSD